MPVTQAIWQAGMLTKISQFSDGKQQDSWLNTAVEASVVLIKT